MKRERVRKREGGEKEQKCYRENKGIVCKRVSERVSRSHVLLCVGGLCCLEPLMFLNDPSRAPCLLLCVCARVFV